MRIRALLAVVAVALLAACTSSPTATTLSDGDNANFGSGMIGAGL